VTSTGQSAAAIRHHYDVGNAFYRLWLDPSLSYSCAWGPGTLEEAQERKLARHLEAAGARTRLLDVGCGWGAILARSEVPAVGLTLSDEQASYVSGLGHDVRVQDWRDHPASESYDGIVSIGAFEHFAAPGSDKIGIYREFFERCRGWLGGGTSRLRGALSLQTIAYADMDPAAASSFMQQEIFPDAELPTLAEITAAAEGVLEVTALSNGRLDYARTCAEWARRLKAHRVEARELVGDEMVRRYERYLTLSSFGFRMGKLALYRITLRPYGSRWAG
jgi:cyclopropane-fatty-acyl-phospholipid synthase